MVAVQQGDELRVFDADGLVRRYRRLLLRLRIVLLLPCQRQPKVRVVADLHLLDLPGLDLLLEIAEADRLHLLLGRRKQERVDQEKGDNGEKDVPECEVKLPVVEREERLWVVYPSFVLLLLFQAPGPLALDSINTFLPSGTVIRLCSRF